MKRIPTFLCLAAVLGLAGAGLVAQDGALAPGTEVRIALRTASLQQEPRLFGSRVATLQEGDVARIVEPRLPWYLVEAAPGRGWLHTSAIATEEKWDLAGVSGAEVSYAERTAAARGFNPEVEAERRAENPQLEKGYRILERFLAREIPLEEIAAFRRAGGLDR